MSEYDYIDVLLQHLADTRLSYLHSDYYIQKEREQLASEALCCTFTEEQHKLFLAYEEEFSARFSISEDAYARQAFLLAREIFK